MHITLRIHKKKKGPTRLVFLVFFILILSLYFVLNFLPKETQASKHVKIESENPPNTDRVLPPLIVNKEVISKGKTLSDILAKYDFSPADIHNLREDIKPVYDLAKLRAGRELRLFAFENGHIISMEYDINKENYLYIELGNEENFAELRRWPYETKTKLIWGVIEDYLIATILDQGENATLAITLEEIFSWDVDFRMDLQPGDEFKIIFEKKYINGEFSGYGNILAAEFTNQGKTYEAFRFTYSDSQKSDYFNYGGASLRKEFLKSPLKSARITSRFSLRRFHPVRRVYRPHYGVDYGAPVGTRVYATGDGVITFAGWSGASGRMLRIRHAKGYQTMYLHLRRFAPGIKKGVRVESGQYIAQVGASGEVNGPHLDYRIKHYNKYINPLAARFDPVEPLRPESMTEFQTQADYYRLAFDAPLLVYATFTYSLPRAVLTEIAD